MDSTERVKPEKMEMDLSSGSTSASSGVPVGWSAAWDMSEEEAEEGRWWWFRWRGFWSVVVVVVTVWPGTMLVLKRRG